MVLFSKIFHRGCIDFKRSSPLAGNRQVREATEPFFLFQHSVSAANFIFSNTMCVTTLAYYTTYLAPLALFPCRGVSRRTDKRTVCNRSFDWALSHGPGCKIPEAQLLLCSSRWSETCGTEEKRPSTKFRCQGPAIRHICKLLYSFECMFHAEFSRFAFGTPPASR